MPEPEVHNRAGEPLDVHNRANEPIDLASFSAKPAVIHELLNKPRLMPERVATITRRPNDFPPVQQVTQTTTTGSGNTVLFSFLLEDATTHDLGPSVLIHDGEVNGTVPTGMGADNLVLSGLFDGCFIDAVITYDPTTLAISSVTFEVDSVIPDPTLGVFYVEIGRVNFDYDVNGNVINFEATNTQCGDINFQLIYGSLNGSPALIPLATYSGFVPVI